MAAPLDAEDLLSDEELERMIESLSTFPPTEQAPLSIGELLPLLEDLLDRRKDPNGYA